MFEPHVVGCTDEAPPRWQPEQDGPLPDTPVSVAPWHAAFAQAVVPFVLTYAP